MSDASQTIAVQIVDVTGNTITFEFETLPGNTPNTYGNWVGLWPNTNVIPWKTAAQASAVIPTDTRDGDSTLTNLVLGDVSYMLGYAVGPEAAVGQKNGCICSTAFIPAAGSDYVYFQTTMTLGKVTPSSVAVQYTAPAGNTPAANGSWIGLWRGSQASYINPPEAQTGISDNASAGTAIIQGVTLQRGETYTLGYFMSQAQTTLAAILSFTH